MEVGIDFVVEIGVLPANFLPVWALTFLTNMGIIDHRVVVEPIVASTWWEWVWEMLGWPYMVERTVCDVNLLVLLLTIVLSYLVVTVVVRTLLDIWRRIRSVFWKLVDYVVVGLQAISRVFQWLASSKAPDKPLFVTAAEYLPESMVANSSLTARTPPKCQGVLGSLSPEGIVKANGCCVRVDIQGVGSFIITPDHVLAGIRDNVCLLGSVGHVELDIGFIQDNVGQRPRERIILDTDVVALRITEVEASRAGIAVATILSTLPNVGALAQICGPTKLGSTGVLRPDNSCFGGLCYEGSTTPGFSGAVYAIGAKAAGIHISGGRRNTGYSLRLGYVTLRALLKVSPEESAEWLERMYKQYRKRIDIDQTWKDLDSIRIRTGGEYHVISVDAFRQVVGEGELLEGYAQYDDSLSAPKYGKSGSRKIPESISAAYSGNGHQIEKSGASRSLTACAPDSYQTSRPSIAELKRLFAELKRVDTKTLLATWANTPGHVAPKPLTASSTTPGSIQELPQE